VKFGVETWRLKENRNGKRSCPPPLSAGADLAAIAARQTDVIKALGPSAAEFPAVRSGMRQSPLSTGLRPGREFAVPPLEDLSQLAPKAAAVKGVIYPAAFIAPDGRVTPGFVDGENLIVQGDTPRVLPLSENVQLSFARITDATAQREAIVRWGKGLPDGFAEDLRPPVQREVTAAVVHVQISFLANLRAREPLGADIISFVETAGTELASGSVLLGGVALEFANLVSHVREQDEGFIRELALRASGILRQKFQPQVIAAFGSATADEYDFGRVDAVWLGLRPLSPSDVTVALADGSLTILRRPLGQLTIRGGYFRLVGEGIHYVYNFPIVLSNGKLGFAVHFVNHLLTVASSDPFARALLSELIFLPLLADLQNGEPILLTETVGRWFTLALDNKFFSFDELVPFAKILNLNSLTLITDPYLGTGLTLFAAYAFANADPDPPIVRDRIAEFVNTVADASDSPASRIARRIAFDLMSPSGNSLSVLGAVGSLALPVITSVAHACFAFTPPEVVAPAALPGPTHERRIEVPDAIGYTVIVSKTVACFLRINGRLQSGSQIEVSGPSFSLTVRSGNPSYPTVTIIPHVRHTSVSPLDSTAVVAAHATLSQALTPATDALLFAAAQLSPVGECPGAIFAKLAPSLPAAAARMRLNLHRTLIGRAVELAHFSQARWLAPVHAQPRPLTGGSFPLRDRPFPPLDSFFVAVSHALSMAPLDRGPFPKRVAGGAPAAEMRPLWGGLFEARGRALLPRADAEAEALIGFGRWLAWIWRAGKPLPLPLSRAAVRAAFGGRIRADDCADIGLPQGASDADAADAVRPLAAALAAIRAGVAAAGVVVEDDPLLPRIFQLRPFKAAHGATRRAAPLETPLVRQAMWETQVRVRNTSSTVREAIDEIIAQFQ
jgi:hypothetical protein